MKKTFYTFIGIVLISCSGNKSKNNVINNETIQKNYAISEVIKIAGDFKFTEGPAVDAFGNIYFTDIPNNLILKWTLDNTLDTFSETSGGANGLYFDKNQNLIACEGEKGQITSTSLKGEKKILAALYNNSRFNKPNDLWPDIKGGIYFTDPMYGGDSDNLPQDGMHVYYITPSCDSVIRVCSDLKKPNGIIGSPDGGTLFVTDPGDSKTWKYEINPNGTLSNKTLFIEVGCDGMTIDNEGNIYITNGSNPSIDIYSPHGQLLESISMPEKPSNVCFGGMDRSTLFVTARTSLYKINMDVRGVD